MYMAIWLIERASVILWEPLHYINLKIWLDNDLSDSLIHLLRFLLQFLWWWNSGMHLMMVICNGDWDKLLNFLPSYCVKNNSWQSVTLIHWPQGEENWMEFNMNYSKLNLIIVGPCISCESVLRWISLDLTVDNNGPNGHLFYVGGDLMMRRGMLPIIMLPDGDFVMRCT